jgi:nitroreductase
MKILDASRFAPSAGNQQPWKFLVVRDTKKLNQLKKEACRWFLESYRSKHRPEEKRLEGVEEGVRESLENALSAPVYVAVLVDSESEHPDYVIYDGTLAAGYLMIAARALGYGTGFYTTFFPEEKMKSFFDIPAKYKLICFTPIGFPESWPETPPKKNLDEVVVFESF